MRRIEANASIMDAAPLETAGSVRYLFTVFRRQTMNLYLRFSLFLLPLIATIFVQEVSVQWIAGGLARLPMPVETLAAFGLAWTISTFLSGPLVYSKQMSLVLVERRQSFRKALEFVLIAIAVVICIQAVVATTGVGKALLLDLHKVSAATTQDVQTLLLWLLLHPLLKGLTHFLTGPLIRNRQTQYVSISSVSGFAVVAAVITFALRLPRFQAEPILLPVTALYMGQTCELLVVIFGVWKHRRAIWATRLHRSSATSALSLFAVLRFFLPLAGIVLIQEFSRPLINLVVARQPDGELYLAAMAVVYALGQWPYRWLNETRNMASSFQHEDPQFRAIRRFNAGSCLASLTLSSLLFWTPVRDWILLSLVGVEATLAALCATPLRLFTFFALAVAARSYMQGMALVERRTPSMVPSALMRLAAIALALYLLPQAGIQGATMGVAALLSGFTVEALTLAMALRAPALLSRRRPAGRRVSA